MRLGRRSHQPIGGGSGATRTVAPRVVLPLLPLAAAAHAERHERVENDSALANRRALDHLQGGGEFRSHNPCGRHVAIAPAATPYPAAYAADRISAAPPRSAPQPGPHGIASQGAGRAARQGKVSITDVLGGDPSRVARDAAMLSLRVPAGHRPAATRFPSHTSRPPPNRQEMV